MPLQVSGHVLPRIFSAARELLRSGELFHERGARDMHDTRRLPFMRHDCLFDEVSVMEYRRQVV